MILLGTDIQAGLGEASPLDYAMLRRAVDAALPETQRLDWKRDPYEQSEKKDAKTVREEFCKDVAALANAQGGILVIGVAEKRGKGTAESLAPFKPTDSLQQKFRSWLHARVHPGIPGVDMAPLYDPDDPDQGALVISVPASPEAPHLVGDHNSVGYPLRDGTQTKWLSEHEIERAYADRFDRRRTDDQALTDLASQASQHLDPEAGCWLIAAVRPSLPLARTAPAITREEARAIGESAVEKVQAWLAEPLNTRDSNLFRSFGDGILNPRLGLRRRIFETYRESHDASTDTVYAEVHDDGSCVIALRGGGYREHEDQSQTQIPDWIVGSLALAIVALARAVADARGLSGNQFIRVTAAHTQPLSFVMPERVGSFTVGAGTPVWSRAVRQLQPAESVLPVPGDGGLDIALDLIQQLSSQFGIDPGNFGWTSERVAERDRA